jgi:hypothetical protein
MRKKVVLVAFADQLTPDWVTCLNRFPADAVVLTGPGRIAQAAEAACGGLSLKGRGRRACAFFALSDISFEAVLDALNLLKGQMPGSVFFINIDAASSKLSASALSAALAAGAYVGFTKDDEPRMLDPVRYSYCTKLSPTKQRILQALSSGPATSLRQLSSRVGLPLSLASYHVHGDSRSMGLFQMRMLDMAREGGRLHIGLAPLGRVYLKTCTVPMLPPQEAVATPSRKG